MRGGGGEVERENEVSSQNKLHFITTRKPAILIWWMYIFKHFSFNIPSHHNLLSFDGTLRFINMLSCSDNEQQKSVMSRLLPHNTPNFNVSAARLESGWFSSPPPTYHRRWMSHDVNSWLRRHKKMLLLWWMQKANSVGARMRVCVCVFVCQIKCNARQRRYITR
jgi:hypothetical protein